MAIDTSFNQAVAAYNNAAKRAVTPEADIAASAQDTGKPSFADLIGDSLKDAVSTGYKSESVGAKALAGQAELVDLVTALGNAELTLNTVVAVRDRVINAYNDIIKMPI